MAQALSSGKIATVIFENMLETYRHQTSLLERVLFYQPSAKEMQNSNNEIWRPVQQSAPVLSGWDIGSQKTGIIEQTYPATVGDPENDFVELRADDVRDPVFWERRGKQSGLQQATYLNKMIAERIAVEGSLYYQQVPNNGYDFIASAETMMAEREIYNSGTRTFILNNRETQRFANDLAGRQTLQGRPEQAWAQNQIGQNIAGFDVLTGSYLPAIGTGIAGSAASINIRLAGDLMVKPLSASKDAIINQDYRRATIRIKGAGLGRLQPGDKVSIQGCNAIAKASKLDTRQPMLFTIIQTRRIPNSRRELIISPRPILHNGANLSVLEQAYSNCTGTLANNASVTIRDTLSARQANVFFDQSAVEVLGGTVPAKLFKQFGGFKVLQDTLPNGQEFYMLYGGNIDDMTFKFRIFTWWGVTIANPEACGTCVTF